MPNFARLSMLASACLSGCGEPEAEACGPAESVVERVIDGDTAELEGGTVVRYLMVDTPESTATTECFGVEAKAANRALVEHRPVELAYDRECTDRYGRLLAYVTVAGREVNTELVERGSACMLHVPPNGAARVREFESLERRAEGLGLGLWGACSERPCEGRRAN